MRLRPTFTEIRPHDAYGCGAACRVTTVRLNSRSCSRFDLQQAVHLRHRLTNSVIHPRHISEPGSVVDRSTARTNTMRLDHQPRTTYNTTRSSIEPFNKLHADSVWSTNRYIQPGLHDPGETSNPNSTAFRDKERSRSHLMEVLVVRHAGESSIRPSPQTWARARRASTGRSRGPQWWLR